MSYPLTLREEELKNKVASEWFHDFDSTQILGNIDFCVSTPLMGDTWSFLWAEAKAGNKKDIKESLVQLILTIGRARTFDKLLPPIFLGAFDAEKFAFIPWTSVMDVFAQNDFNWNVTPSNHDTKEFRHLSERVKGVLESESLLFDFDENGSELKDFIDKNFVIGKSHVSRIAITKNNFTAIYAKWAATVKPTINADWDKAKANGILDADFYLADILSSENMTLKDKLFVLLKSDHYEFDRSIDDSGFDSVRSATFRDGQKAHGQFWNRYSRPPREEFWQYIIDRRDLLVPQDVRERKGSYFTPRCWVELSQKYLADVYGENWQDEYDIWDCAAGTGNLLNGLTNKYKIWASTLDKADVDVMKDRIANGANLLESHVFQFDFLNDDFSKCPKALQEIIHDPERRKKLIIYINPPYAEHGNKRQLSGMGKNKAGVAETAVYQKYQPMIGTAARELYAQFLIRVSQEIPTCGLAQFSKLKTVQARNFGKFREAFNAKLEKLFLVPADTFDNVKGKFPIGFFIWSTGQTDRQTDNVQADVYDVDGKYCGIKNIYNYDNKKLVIEWLRQFYDTQNSYISFLRMAGTDIQNQDRIFITNGLSDNDIREKLFTFVTCNNIIEISIYFAIRQVIPATWLNDRDQYLYPLPSWKTDKEFQTNCLAWTLFNNNIQAARGVNHWIPFTEAEVDAKEAFQSRFMTDYIAGKLKPAATGTLSLLGNHTGGAPTAPLAFSEEARAVFDAGREVWRYYHTQPGINPNAALYDIKERFCGRDGKGTLKSRSEDERYNALMDDLKAKLKELAAVIEPKVYEHGFLLR